MWCSVKRRLNASLTAECDSYHKCSFNSLPDDKILDWSKLKQLADDILNCIENGK